MKKRTVPLLHWNRLRAQARAGVKSTVATAAVRDRRGARRAQSPDHTDTARCQMVDPVPSTRREGEGARSMKLFLDRLDEDHLSAAKLAPRRGQGAPHKGRQTAGQIRFSLCIRSGIPRRQGYFT